MKIIIPKGRYIEDIKTEFNNAFPYLKIDFRPETNAAVGMKPRMSATKIRLGDILKDNPEGVNSMNEIIPSNRLHKSSQTILV